MYDVNISVRELENFRGDFDNNIGFSEYDNNIKELFEKIEIIFNMFNNYKLSVNQIIEKILDELMIINKRNKYILKNQQLVYKELDEKIKKEMITLYHRSLDYSETLFKNIDEKILSLIETNNKNEEDVIEFQNNFGIITSNYGLIHNHLIRKIENLEDRIDNVVNNSPNCKEGKERALESVETCLYEENNEENSYANDLESNNIDYENNFINRYLKDDVMGPWNNFTINNIKDDEDVRCFEKMPIITDEEINNYFNENKNDKNNENNKIDKISISSDDYDIINYD